MYYVFARIRTAGSESPIRCGWHQFTEMELDELRAQNQQLKDENQHLRNEHQAWHERLRSLLGQDGPDEQRRLKQKPANEAGFFNHSIF